MRCIDAHPHYWQIGLRAGYWPPAELAPIFRDFGPEDLQPDLDANPMEGTALDDMLGDNACRFYRIGAAASRT
jgi:L-fuconolactonase